MNTKILSRLSKSTNDPTLTSLDLSYNRIGAEGSKYISDALKTNSTLTSLSLGCNQIVAEGSKLIKELLERNKWNKKQKIIELYQIIFNL